MLHCDHFPRLGDIDSYVSLVASWIIFLINSGTSAEHREIGRLYTRGVATAHQLSWKRFHKPLRAHSLDVHCIYVQHRCSLFFFLSVILHHQGKTLQNSTAAKYVAL